MKVFFGTSDEFKEVAHLFQDETTESASKTSQVDLDNEAAKDDAIRQVVRRIPLAENYKILFRILADGPVTTEQINERAGWDSSALRGVMGGLGRRVNGTKAIHEVGLPGNSEAIVKWESDGGKWFYSLQPRAAKVLKDLGLI